MDLSPTIKHISLTIEGIHLPLPYDTSWVDVRRKNYEHSEGYLYVIVHQRVPSVKEWKLIRKTESLKYQQLLKWKPVVLSFSKDEVQEMLVQVYYRHSATIQESEHIFVGQSEFRLGSVVHSYDRVLDATLHGITSVSQGSLRFSAIFEKSARLEKTDLQFAAHCCSFLQIQTAKFAFPRKGNFYVELSVQLEYDVDEKKIGRTEIVNMMPFPIWKTKISFEYTSYSGLKIFFRIYSVESTSIDDNSEGELVGEAEIDANRIFFPLKQPISFCFHAPNSPPDSCAGYLFVEGIENPENFRIFSTNFSLKNLYSLQGLPLIDFSSASSSSPSPSSRHFFSSQSLTQSALKASYYLLISRRDEFSGDWKTIYKSKTIDYNYQLLDWENCRFTLHRFHLEQLAEQLRISIWEEKPSVSKSKPLMIGYLITSLQELLIDNTRSLPIILSSSSITSQLLNPPLPSYSSYASSPLEGSFRKKNIFTSSSSFSSSSSLVSSFQLELVVSESNIEIGSTFRQFTNRKGFDPFQIQFAIDYTKSNGKRKLSTSLHHLSTKSIEIINQSTKICGHEEEETAVESTEHPYYNSVYTHFFQEYSSTSSTSSAGLKIFNPYQRCLLSLGNLFHDCYFFIDPNALCVDVSAVPGNYSIVGFGAALDGSKEVNDSFSLHPDRPSLSTMKEVLTAYCEFMPRLTFAGPTNILEILSQLLEKLQQIEESHQKKQIPVYSILFILTDGIVRDMKKTIDLLIRSTSFPVSIVIIGIGDHDFINMRLLEDSEVYYDYLQDEMDVRNSLQQQTEQDDEMDSRSLSNQQSLPDLPVYHRNNVQFLSFERTENQRDPTEFVKTIMLKVSEQYIEYMESHGYLP